MNTTTVFGTGFKLLALITSALGLLMAGKSIRAAEATNQLNVKWQLGPTVSSLEHAAEIKVPKGYRFADAAETRRVKKAIGEPVSGHEAGMMVPELGDWSVFFTFSDDGYVKDDDRDKLNADKLLKAITQGNDYANKQREKMGTPPINVVGWDQKPFYDASTHNLEWCLRAECEGQPLLNYNTRLLGRRGVMSVVLVCDPNELQATLPIYKELLAGYSYKPGETYAEYRQGDKLAKYGLAALITGGAVAVAAKTGLLASIVLLFKKGWKLVIIGVVAIGAFIKRLVTGDRARSVED
jgi:uncharacterized membrane-anchored protein